MKKADVKLGAIYLVKVSGLLVPVKLHATPRHGGGWFGVNLLTNRTIRIKSAGKLREEMRPSEAAMMMADHEERKSRGKVESQDQ